LSDELFLALAAILNPPSRLDFAKSLGFDPDPWQTEVLDSTSKRVLINSARQTGKSTVVSLIVAHTAIYRPGSLCLIVSPGDRQSGEFFAKVREVFAIAKQNGGLQLDEDNKTSAKLANGSRIVSLPGTHKTIRGYSGPAIIVEDEAAQVPDDIFGAILPMLAVSNGSLYLLSTPYGKRGHFYELWQGPAEWHRIQFLAENCPRYSSEYLEDMRTNMPPQLYRQEFECSFEETEDQVFREEDIQRTLSDSVEEMQIEGLSWQPSLE
jgi:Terminase large subunit, T4likevirus-type, N-terminal